jgi:hypothetical protein
MNSEQNPVCRTGRPRSLIIFTLAMGLLAAAGVVGAGTVPCTCSAPLCCGGVVSDTTRCCGTQVCECSIEYAGNCPKVVFAWCR